MRIFGLPAFAQGFFGEAGDVLFRLGHRRPQRFIGRERGVEQFGLGHGELFRGEFGAIEFFREFQHRVVAAHRDLVQDRFGALLDFGVEQAGVGGQLAEFGGKILVGMTGNFHGGSLWKKTGQVKSRRHSCRGIQTFRRLALGAVENHFFGPHDRYNSPVTSIRT